MHKSLTKFMTTCSLWPLNQSPSKIWLCSSLSFFSSSTFRSARYNIMRLPSVSSSYPGLSHSSTKKCGRRQSIPTYKMGSCFTTFKTRYALSIKKWMAWYNRSTRKSSQPRWTSRSSTLWEAWIPSLPKVLSLDPVHWCTSQNILVNRETQSSIRDSPLS
jgi:hypothetical protein